MINESARDSTTGVSPRKINVAKGIALGAYYGNRHRHTKQMYTVMWKQHRSLLQGIVLRTKQGTSDRATICICSQYNFPGCIQAFAMMLACGGMCVSSPSITLTKHRIQYTVFGGIIANAACARGMAFASLTCNPYMLALPAFCNLSSISFTAAANQQLQFIHT